jgi:hypothetical protein
MMLAMGMRLPSSIAELTFPEAAEYAHSSGPSEIKIEVMAYFDQFRDPIVRPNPTHPRPATRV